MELKSSEFDYLGPIPTRFTCEGQNVSPPLNWTNLPKDTQRLALIMGDPDAPNQVWIHWILYDIPPTIEGLAINTDIGKMGLNSWMTLGYKGPCPPTGKHNYVFKLYALDTVLKLKTPTRNSLNKAMRDHILGKAVLIGTYQKSKFA